MGAIGFFVVFSMLVPICISDWKNRVIPNNYLLLCALGVILVCLSHGLYINLIYAFLFLAVGILLWSLKVWGAGDAKLLAVLSPLVLPKFYLLTVLLVLIFGSVLAAITFLLKRASNENSQTVAYGIPISLANMAGIILSIAVGYK